MAEGFYADIPASGGDAGWGRQRCLGLSRQRFLIDLGKSYFLDGVGSHSAEVRRLVRSWIEGNLCSGRQLGQSARTRHRALSGMGVLLLIDDPQFDPDDHLLG